MCTQRERQREMAILYIWHDVYPITIASSVAYTDCDWIAIGIARRTAMDKQ